MSEKLTRVELFFLDNQTNYWLRFGKFIHEKNIDRRRAFVWFKPGQIFCYIRWWANDYGTQSWAMAILQSYHLGNNVQNYPGIEPGVDILLRVKGKTYVQRVLNILDDIENLNISLSEVSPNYYRYLGHYIMTSNLPHPYTVEQHHAFQEKLVMA